MLKNKEPPTPIKEYDDDEKYLLSFYGDMQKMTHSQKIDFKLGMMQLLKNTFRENVPSIPTPAPTYYSSSPSPASSYTSTCQDGSHTWSTKQVQQSRYSNQQIIITTPSSQQGILSPLGSDAGQYEALGEQYEYRQSDAGAEINSPASHTQGAMTSRSNSCQSQLNQYLTFK